MLNLWLTFDYELFMGRNYVSEEEVLIEPSYAIAEALKSIGVNATFFADVLCPIRYRELGKDKFPTLFDQQIVDLAKNQFDIQLHIHPHWLKVTAISPDIVFPREAYRIHAFENEKERIIHEGVTYLNNLLLPIDTMYKCVSYRAGGWCIQPEKIIAKTLYDEGIRIDSSVSYGFHADEEWHYSDFRDYSENRNCFFSSNYGFGEGDNSYVEHGIFEVPIASYSRFPNTMVVKMQSYKKKISSVEPKGTYMTVGNNLTSGNHHRTLSSIIKNQRNHVYMLSFDSCLKKSVIYMINHILVEQCKKNEEVYLALIAHPKCQTAEHIENMIDTLIVLQKNKNIRFVTSRDILRYISSRKEGSCNEV